MTDLLAILIGVVLVNHLVLVRIPAHRAGPGEAAHAGLRPGAALVTALALALAAAVTWLIDALLFQPLGLRELRLPTLVLGVLAAVPLLALPVGFRSPSRSAALRTCRPVILINCVLLGVALQVTRESPAFGSAVAWALATGLAFPAVLALFAEMQERLESADVPPSFAGAAIALVSAGLISLAFTGVTGMARG